ncbi:MAG: dienelactone hydrolase family protein [Caldilineaceae bacterium]|nr:dienelactone hydrolase family protein [Caldilineaceae bacterium]
MSDPHLDAPIYYAGKPLGQSPNAMIMLHGRGSSADNILSLAAEFQRPGWTYIAPQATNNTWYPYPFLAPIPQNEPYLSSALQLIQSLLLRLADVDILPSQTVLLGFSQGACLATEFAARHAQAYGGVIGLSGGLIGPPGTPRDYPGEFMDTPVFLGCSDRDAHIPLERVHESAAVFETMGASVLTRIYPGMAHTINADELTHVTAILDRVANPESPAP